LASPSSPEFTPQGGGSVADFGFRIVNMSKTEFKELPEEIISNLEKDYERLKRFYLSL